MPESGDVACDHFHRWREDVGLMADLGIDAYRFSTAWTRILPEGQGAVSEDGLEFYSDLVDELLRNGITPWLTLYHWDLPQALEDKGGWLERDTVDAFVEYADVISANLGDRVTNWITHNEPWVAAYLGYGNGVFAPGIADLRSAFTAGHHILLSHGRSVPVIRAHSVGANVGIAVDCRPTTPATDDPGDVQAHLTHDAIRNRWFFDPLFGKGYPSEVVGKANDAAPNGIAGTAAVQDGDLDEIGVYIDFLGLNFYSSYPVSAADPSGGTAVRPEGPDQPEGFTEMGWEITPTALTDYLISLDKDYSPKAIVVTENGASYSEGPDDNGVIADERRIAYLDSHINATAEARRRGVPVNGYFVWSLLDNLEWTSGYSQRFGIVWVDHSTGQRIPKQSYHWYGSIVATGIEAFG